MPKSRGPGGKNRKKAKGSSLNNSKRELIFAEDGQAYAYVTDARGDGRYTVFCNDLRERIAILRGKMWKRCWIRRCDVILVTLRDYQDGKCDIVHKYNGEEILRLMSVGEMKPELCKYYNLGEHDTSADAENDDVLVFEDADEMDLSGI